MSTPAPIDRPYRVPADPRRRSRVGLTLLALLLVALGLIGRAVLPDAAGDVAGGLLYAALIYVLVAIVAPRASAVLIGGIALAIVLGVELLQLTGLPAALSDAFPPAHLVLGSTFAVSDLVVGAAGVALMAVTDVVLAGPRGRAPRT